MKGILLIVVGILCLSCASTKKFSIEPYKAKIPELRFDYLKNNEWLPVFGHGGDYFVAGDLKQFKIKVHKKSVDCEVRVIDGDSDKVFDCNGKSEYIVDLGKYGESAKEPPVLGISVATRNLGIQQGFFYPSMDKARDPISVEFKCPYQTTTQNLSVCTRPATYDFNMKVEVKDNKVGELMFRYKCGNTNLVEKVIPINSTGFHEFGISSSSPTYCVVFFGLRQDKQADGTYAIVKSRIIHVRFYEETYIPLSQPTITKTGDGWEACAVENYEALSVNGKDKINTLFSGKCIKVKEEKVEVDVWDDIGRFSWKVEPKSEKYINLFSFYNEARPYVLNILIKKCNNISEDCVKKNYQDILSDSKIIEAVTNWDSSYLD